MLGEESHISPEQVAAEQAALQREFNNLRRALEDKFGTQVNASSVEAARKAHAALLSLAQWLRLPSSVNCEPALEDPRAWQAALEEFVAARVGEKVQGDVRAVAEQVEEKVAALRTGELDELRKSLAVVQGSLNSLGELVARSEGTAGEADQRLSAAETRLADLASTVESLAAVAESLREAVPPSGRDAATADRA